MYPPVRGGGHAKGERRRCCDPLLAGDVERESQGGGGGEEDGATLKRCLFCGEYAFHLEILRECGGRVINRTVWRSLETSGGVGFFDRRREARRPSVKALKLKLASLLCGRAAARLK